MYVQSFSISVKNALMAFYACYAYCLLYFYLFNALRNEKESTVLFCFTQRQGTLFICVLTPQCVPKCKAVPVSLLQAKQNEL